MFKLNSLFPIHSGDRAIGHVFFSLCKRWQGPDLQARMIVPSCEPSCRGPNVIEGVSPFLKWWFYRIPNAPKNMAEKLFLKDLRNFDAAYLWPSTSLETLRKVKEINKPIFVERINCHTGKAKLILDDAYIRLGMAPQHPNTHERLQQEQAELSLADFVFCPSLEVRKSFQEMGVPEQKLISTSYGWCPQRFPTVLFPTCERKLVPKAEVSVLFVGTICVRKGAHLLLRAWKLAGVKGRLVMIGGMEPAIAESCGEILARSDVVHLDYSLNYASAYCEADIFALPSLEEGSPLVTYEAMAHGLPILTSPMGAGGIVRDDVDGIIISPYDDDAWVEALRKLANSPELRVRLGTSARQWVEEFTWDKVAARRAACVIERLKAC